MHFSCVLCIKITFTDFIYMLSGYKSEANLLRNDETSVTFGLH